MRTIADATGHGTATMLGGAEGSAVEMEKQLTHHAARSCREWRGAPARWRTR